MVSEVNPMSAIGSLSFKWVLLITVSDIAYMINKLVTRHSFNDVANFFNEKLKKLFTHHDLSCQTIKLLLIPKQPKSPQPQSSAGIHTKTKYHTTANTITKS